MKIDESKLLIYLHSWKNRMEGAILASPYEQPKLQGSVETIDILLQEIADGTFNKN